MSALADQIHTACLLEAAAAKPGNVHPRQSFDDMDYSDLVRSADAVSEILARAPDQGVGPTILEATRATAEVVSCNTNLGIILLLAPLAAVPEDETLDEGIGGVLDRLDRLDRPDHRDTECVYQAIRLAAPGGLGHSDQHDVAETPSVPLMEAMRVAADRDGVAAAYHDRFQKVLDWSRKGLTGGESFAGDWEAQVIGLALSIQAEQLDTLIARKCGQAIAREASQRAQAVLEAGWPSHPDAAAALSRFDGWLREDGHRRNPGTTADLVTAALFAALRENRIVPPNLDSLGSP